VRRFVAGAVAVVAIASTAVACTQPTAPPSRPMVPTGRQLSTMLLPASSFTAGTRADGEFDSSKTPITGHGLAQPNILEDLAGQRPCTALGSDNFGQIAYAVDQMITPARDSFLQQINQFPTPIAATRYFSRYYSDFASCAPRYGSGGNSSHTILAVQQLTVDGYHAFALTYYYVSSGQAPIADVAYLAADDGSAVLLEGWQNGGSATDPAAAIAALEPRITVLIANVAKARR
jgi:hypothetical protein